MEEPCSHHAMQITTRNIELIHKLRKAKHKNHNGLGKGLIAPVRLVLQHMPGIVSQANQQMGNEASSGAAGWADSPKPRGRTQLTPCPK